MHGKVVKRSDLWNVPAFRGCPPDAEHVVCVVFPEHEIFDFGLGGQLGRVLERDLKIFAVFFFAFV